MEQSYNPEKHVRDVNIFANYEREWQEIEHLIFLRPKEDLLGGVHHNINYAELKTIMTNYPLQLK
ncbi:MAG: hypothetical protein O3A01_06735 [bacterium]|nr:hypothetical protein [bacterium]